MRRQMYFLAVEHSQLDRKCAPSGCGEVTCLHVTTCWYIKCWVWSHIHSPLLYDQCRLLPPLSLVGGAVFLTQQEWAVHSWLDSQMSCTCTVGLFCLSDCFVCHVFFFVPGQVVCTGFFFSDKRKNQKENVMTVSFLSGPILAQLVLNLHWVCMCSPTLS